ncbi:MAG TPA: DUF3419 domain-containing protein [Armatimonadota bacterium]|nr:DUF3419 domain-containing protein [Armatimonadota bacterium]
MSQTKHLGPWASDPAPRAPRPVPRAPRILPDSPWRRGRLDRGAGAPELLFGRMHEDWTIEAAVAPPGGRIFCIASAGCTAMALSGLGFEVTAVDLNPVQVEYVRGRLAGAPQREGTAERMIGLARRAARLVGWSEIALRTFLMMEDLGEQIQFWKRRLDRPLFRLGMSLAFRPAALRLFYDPPLTRILPRRFGTVFHSRLDRGFSIHPNRMNPYAWRTWLGCGPPGWDAPPARPEAITLACADAAEYLENEAPGSFDAFSLSNILDGPDEEYGRRLFAAVRHAAAPGAIMVLRSFREPVNRPDAAWAARDRSMLWGSVRVVEGERF